MAAAAAVGGYGGYGLGSPYGGGCAAPYGYGAPGYGYGMAEIAPPVAVVPYAVAPPNTYVYVPPGTNGNNSNGSGVLPGRPEPPGTNPRLHNDSNGTGNGTGDNGNNGTNPGIHGRQFGGGNTGDQTNQPGAGTNPGIHGRQFGGGGNSGNQTNQPGVGTNPRLNGFNGGGIAGRPGAFAQQANTRFWSPRQGAVGGAMGRAPMISGAGPQMRAPQAGAMAMQRPMAAGAMRGAAPSAARGPVSRPGR